nr:hypothetical protein [Nocardia asiatica]
MSTLPAWSQTGWPIGRIVTVLRSTPVGWSSAKPIASATASGLIAMGGSLAVPERGVDYAWVHDRDSDAAGRGVQAEVFGEADHCPLRGGVEVARAVLDSGHAADEHQPAAGLLEVGQGRLGQQSRAEHVGEHHRCPEQRIAAVDDAGAARPEVIRGRAACVRDCRVERPKRSTVLVTAV